MIPTMLAQLVSAPIGPRWLIEYSWLIWFIAAIIAHFGLNFLWRTLFKDPDRKKRRCPKCWYDMTGVNGLRCPECGREQASEKKLHKSRRKRFKVIAALTVLLIAFSIAVAPRIAQRGWINAIPTVPILAASFIYDTHDLKLFNEVAKRAAQTRFAPSVYSEVWPPFMRRMFIARARLVLMMPAAPSQRFMGMSIDSQKSAVLSQLFYLPSNEFDALAAIIPAINHPDPGVQRLVIQSIKLRFPDVPPRILPALRQVLSTSDPALFEEAARWLATKPVDQQDVQAIIQGVRRNKTGLTALIYSGPVAVDAYVDFLDDPNLAALAAKDLLSIPASDRHVDKMIHVIRTSPSEEARAACILYFYMRRIKQPEILRTLVDALKSDPSERVRVATLQYVVERNGRQTTFLIPETQLVPVLILGLSAQTPLWRQQCLQTLPACGAAAVPALPALQAIVDNPGEQQFIRAWASRAIASINAASRGETLPDDSFPPFNPHPAFQLPSAPVPGTVPPPSPAPSPSP